MPEAMALATATPDGAPSVRMVLLEGLRRARARLLLAPHLAEGTRARGEPAGRAPLPLVAARPPGAGRGEGRARLRGGVGRVLRDAPARRAGRRARLAAERAARVAGGAGRAARGDRERARRRPGAAAADVGRFPARAAAWEFWQHRASRLHDRFRYEREPSGELADRAALPLARSDEPLGPGGSAQTSIVSAEPFRFVPDRRRLPAPGSSDRSTRPGSTRSEGGKHRGADRFAGVRPTCRARPRIPPRPFAPSRPSRIVASTAAPFGMLAARTGLAGHVDRLHLGGVLGARAGELSDRIQLRGRLGRPMALRPLHDEEGCAGERTERLLVRRRCR